MNNFYYDRRGCKSRIQYCCFHKASPQSEITQILFVSPTDPNLVSVGKAGVWRW